MGKGAPSPRLTCLPCGGAVRRDPDGEARCWACGRAAPIVLPLGRAGREILRGVVLKARRPLRVWEILAELQGQGYEMGGFAPKLSKLTDF